MRQRLSWELDKEKKADMDKKADPYTMNQDHKNNPVQKYDIGGPSQFAEDPDMKTPWKTEGRTETGHPAPEREAVMAARKMEDKAMKCLTIAQRMLPGASDELIEEQATEFMYMPEQSVLATLQRQASWAETLAGKDEEEEEEKEEKEAAKKEEEDEEEKEAAKKEEDEEEKEASEEKKPVAEEKEAKKEEEEEEKEAAKKEETSPEPEKKEEEKEASEEKKPVAKKEEEEEEKEAAKAEDEEEEEKEASEEKTAEEEIDLLDSLFATDETKTGAKKLSGIVKQASSDNGSLDSLWKSSTPPDVSEAFK